MALPYMVGSVTQHCCWKPLVAISHHTAPRNKIYNLDRAADEINHSLKKKEQETAQFLIWKQAQTLALSNNVAQSYPL